MVEWWNQKFVGLGWPRSCIFKSALTMQTENKNQVSLSTKWRCLRQNLNSIHTSAPSCSSSARKTLALNWAYKISIEMKKIPTVTVQIEIKLFKINHLIAIIGRHCHSKSCMYDMAKVMREHFLYLTEHNSSLKTERFHSFLMAL